RARRASARAPAWISCARRRFVDPRKTTIVEWPAPDPPTPKSTGGPSPPPSAGEQARMWARVARLTVAILLPVAFLALFFWNIDVGRLRGALAGIGAGWGLLFLAALVQVVHLLIRALRWRILLGPLKKNVGY